MKKLIFAALFGFSAVAAAAPQPVVDANAVAQLTEIRNILLTNQQKAYACSDGEKLYTVGLQIKRKRTARTVLTGMCYSVGSVMRQGSSS
nr:hypothetical protein [Enterobacter asburiae]